MKSFNIRKLVFSFPLLLHYWDETTLCTSLLGPLPGKQLGKKALKTLYWYSYIVLLIDYTNLSAVNTSYHLIKPLPILTYFLNIFLFQRFKLYHLICNSFQLYFSLAIAVYICVLLIHHSCNTCPLKLHT